MISSLEGFITFCDEKVAWGEVVAPKPEVPSVGEPDLLVADQECEHREDYVNGQLPAALSPLLQLGRVWLPAEVHQRLPRGLIAGVMSRVGVHGSADQQHMGTEP